MNESAKQRSLRVPLDHFQRPDRVLRVKWLLSFVSTLAALVYAGWLLFGGRAGQHHAAPGPVAAAHAAWNDECQACHREFQPLRADAVQLTRIAARKPANDNSLDEACIRCHNEPPHHAAALAGEVPHCAACHQDHRGAGADLIRPRDEQCLACHRDLDHHRAGPSRLSPAISTVTGFGPPRQNAAQAHPEFRSLQSDPGRVKFNHWLHMQPGIATAAGKRKLQLSDIEEALQPRYATFAQPTGLLQLDCAACHQPDSASGASMRPIAYEQHCRACHPLQFKIRGGQPPAEIPHGLSAARLRPVLSGLLFAAAQKEHPDQSPTDDESGNAPLVPGKTLGKNLAQKIQQDLLGRLTAATSQIAAKCQECHDRRASADEESTEWPDVAPASIPSLWFKHARFDHNAHRHVQCRQCHEAAFAFEQHDQPRLLLAGSDSKAARDNEQVMIAGLENCARCHAPPSGGQGGARYDCAECHNYHGGDHFTSPVSASHTQIDLHRSSLAVSSPARHSPEAPAAPAGLAPIHVRLAHFTALAKPDSPALGSSTCAAAGCHGSTNADAPPWQSAFTTWVARDPHAQAYEVLWTSRARQMTRHLAAAEDEQQHAALLRDRCIGCHAAPSSQVINTNSGSVSLGIGCESCHGPAGAWLHRHDQVDFSRHATAGFIDTKDLSQRAAVCQECHVGPNNAAGNSQVVDHELIAAGHPRLAFEFHSYFESLPPHWNRTADQLRSAGAFHFRSWLAGQLQLADQRHELQRQLPGDFAHFDCFACHHSLRGESCRQQSPAASPPLVAPPSVALPPVAWPPSNWLHAAQQDPSLSARLHLLRDLLSATTGEAARWDAALQSFLAARAVAGDITIQEFPRASSEIRALEAALTGLRDYLGQDCFPADLRPPTQYDSPTEFNPARLAEKVQPLLEAIQRLDATSGKTTASVSQ